ncbi:TlpA family protein disulfide reductase [Dyadobacter fermentans]|uniref:Alkyl hydroperoxide reductase/ Thiol specific antioxidant/ Mal allergen n=1 Tax=Dyadobacter fermentans (strain ATCC 700827 / DSM 18053 / CIP 107007 / KCTC 52180 / NS114) TaxID=471854 RepID=C6VXE5_DYAFD|nr:TlpA disulfide reductase family protein [Dyadobacter fermentans]ACT93288.1 alkyl hydroperoxide reductase/ Thiol specific antioxidant/ Mal allergen [Dyadobacter fermentans DSM 18053]
MRYPLYIYLVCFGIVFLFTGCEYKKNNSVKVTIDYPKLAGDTVSIGRVNMVDVSTIELGKVLLDSAGKGVVEVEVEAPVFAHINGKELAAGILIYPGDEIEIAPSAAGARLAVQFRGDGAAVNQALNETQQIRSEFEKWNGTYYFQLNSEDFLAAKDSLQKSYDHLFSKLKSDTQVSAERLALLTHQTGMHVVSYQYNFAIGKDTSEIPAQVRRVVEHLPIDTVALQSGMFDYSLVASQFFQHRINNAVYEENDQMDSDSLESIFPMMVEKKIKANEYPKPIEDFIRVKSADVQIRLNGLSPNMITLANTIEKEVASEELKKVIREDVSRWEKLGPGKPAPDFTGTTPDGKKLALSDLRGKIVYVDIWATWCGPCVGEFPESKKVHSEFKEDDRVAFLYVSIDRDTLAWKKMVAAGRVPAGHHMLTSADAPESVWNLYHVWGIPRYLLIDAQGRMVATHAVRPSSGNVQGELRKLLSKSRIAQK